MQIAAREGVGIENIDLQAATMAGVMVMNIPEVNARAAAEHAFALLLRCAAIPEANASLRSGEWERGLFGEHSWQARIAWYYWYGSCWTIGCKRARAFGMDVLAFDPYVSEEIADSLKVELT